MPPITRFQDMQNLVLWRMRARGVNFGNVPTASANDQTPPAVIQGLLNAGYNEFLSRTLESGIATVKVAFLSVANATAFSLRPLPVSTDGVTPNPAALRVLEGTYTTAVGGQNASIEYDFDIVSTREFKGHAGAYTRRGSWFGPRIQYAAQLYGRPQLDVLPGCATAGDTIQLTIVPDPANSVVGVTAARGGELAQPTDVPLFPQQFHMALVEYALWQANLAAGRDQQAAAAMAAFEKYVVAAQEFGATYGNGDAERGVTDVYA